MYSVLLGLIAVAVWSNFSSVSGLVSREASTIGVLYRDVSGYPDPLCLQLRQGLRAYTVFVVEKSWPAQQHGERLSQPTDMITRMHEAILGYHPPDAGAAVMHAEILRKFNELLDARRLRIDRVDDGLPGILWVVVIIGGLLTITVSYFLWIEDVRFHVLLLSMLSLFIGLMIFLIAALDRPCRGSVSVPPTSYQTILMGVMDVLDAELAQR